MRVRTLKTAGQSGAVMLRLMVLVCLVLMLLRQAMLASTIAHLLLSVNAIVKGFAKRTAVSQVPFDRSYSFFTLYVVYCSTHSFAKRTVASQVPFPKIRYINQSLLKIERGGERWREVEGEVERGGEREVEREVEREAGRESERERAREREGGREGEREGGREGGSERGGGEVERRRGGEVERRRGV